MPGEFRAVFEAHGALGPFGGVAGLAQHDEAVGEGEAVAADDGALVALDDGEVIGPFAAAEVAEDVGLLDVIGVGAGAVHGGAGTQLRKNR